MTKVYRAGLHGLEKANIEIDGQKYVLDSMTDEQAKHVTAIEEIQAHLKFLDVKLRIAQAARTVHLELLKKELSKVH